MTGVSVSVVALLVALVLFDTAAQASMAALFEGPAPRLLGWTAAAPILGGLVAMVFGAKMALGVGAALVVLGSTALLLGSDLVAALLLIPGQGVLLTCSIAYLAGGRRGPKAAKRETTLLAVWAGMAAWSSVTTLLGDRSIGLPWIVFGLGTASLGTLAVVYSPAPKPYSRAEDPPLARLASGSLLALGLIVPVAVGSAFRELMELGRLSPEATGRELGLGSSGELLALLLGLGVLLRRPPPSSKRLAAAALVVCAASLFVSPALLGVHAGRALFGLQLLTNFGQGWGVVVIPLALAWSLRGLSVRSSAIVVSIVLGGLGLAEASAPAFSSWAAQGTTSARAAVVLVALMASVVAGAAGTVLWIRAGAVSPRSGWRSAPARR